MLKKVTYKFPGTHKVRSFIVYPDYFKDNTLTIQADDAIARFDKLTGQGRYAVNAGGAHFAHLAIKAKAVTFPMDFVQQCIEAQPKSGDEIAPGGYIA